MPKLKPKVKRSIIQEIKTLMGKNYSDEEIIEKLELRPQALSVHKRDIFDSDKAAFAHLDSSGVYTDYILKVRQLIRELDNVIIKFRNRGQYTALVAAIKTKSELYDKVIKLGQDFGFIEKKVAEMKVSAEVAFTTKSEADVRKEIEAELKAMHKLVQGATIPMRPEIATIAGLPMKRYSQQAALPAPSGDDDEDSGDAPKKSDRSTKTKIKMTLRRRV